MSLYVNKRSAKRDGEEYRELKSEGPDFYQPL